MRAIFIKGRDEVKFVHVGIERHRSLYQISDRCRLPDKLPGEGL